MSSDSWVSVSPDEHPGSASGRAPLRAAAINVGGLIHTIVEGRLVSTHSHRHQALTRLCEHAVSTSRDVLVSAQFQAVREHFVISTDGSMDRIAGPVGTDYLDDVAHLAREAASASPQVATTVGNARGAGQTQSRSVAGPPRTVHLTATGTSARGSRRRTRRMVAVVALATVVSFTAGWLFHQEGTRVHAQLTELENLQTSTSTLQPGSAIERSAVLKVLRSSGATVKVQESSLTGVALDRVAGDRLLAETVEVRTNGGPAAHRKLAALAARVDREWVRVVGTEHVGSAVVLRLLMWHLPD